jgi:hypothetical protein
MSKKESATPAISDLVKIRDGEYSFMFNKLRMFVSAIPDGQQGSVTVDGETENNRKYFIVDITGLGLESVESEVNAAQGAVLEAVLKSEFYDNGDDLQVLCGYISKAVPVHRIEDAAAIIDRWFTEKRDQIHELFDFITDLRPAAITGCEVVNRYALLEFSESLIEQPEDFGAVDLTDLDDEPEDEVEEEGE